MSKNLLMIAGPNGAGKTTMTLELIANSPLLYEFINADEIAKGLSPLRPESVALSASKLMIERLKQLLSEGKSFAFETTAAGTNYLKHLQAAKAQGYTVHLTYLWLASPQQAIKRVAERVCQGGHHIEKNVIIRRYYAGIKNLLNFYLEMVDSAVILDNSSRKTPVVAEKEPGNPLEIKNHIVWNKIKELAHDRQI